MECIFKRFEEYEILKERNCGGCKFRKSYEQFRDGKINAAKSLKERGLKKNIKTIDGVRIVTVERREK